MKFENKLQEGVFLRRYKRFFVDIATAGNSELTVHCANTGSMTGCSTPGAPVWYSTSRNPNRKLKHSLELVQVDDGHVVCVNTARANQLVEEALMSGSISQVPGAALFRREVTIPNVHGRLDFGNDSTVIEVKSVTWGHLGVGCFPDAPSTRAQRHVETLRELVAIGYDAILFFAVLHTGVERVTVAEEIDPEYANAMEQALNNNVKVIAYRWKLSPIAMSLDQEIPFNF